MAEFATLYKRGRRLSGVAGAALREHVVRPGKAEYAKALRGATLSLEWQAWLFVSIS